MPATKQHGYPVDIFCTHLATKRASPPPDQKPNKKSHSNEKGSTSTCFQLLYGRLSDVWSRKLVLFIGLAIFFIGSLAASLAQTATQLIVFRAFTGVGGGGLVTLAQMVVSDIVPLRERGKYQGIMGSVVAIANGIGPVIGGALASAGPDSWRWIF